MSTRKPLHPECNGSITCTVERHVRAKPVGRSGVTLAHIPLSLGQRKTLRERQGRAETETR
jgi:hypothetical protein